MLAALLRLDGGPIERADIEHLAGGLGSSGSLRRRQAPGVAMLHLLQPFAPEERFERQPYVDPSGRYWLFADARLDNRDDLLRAFELSAERGAVTSDVELVAMAWQRWGEGIARHLRGDFAIAVWDCSQRRLFCLCDPMGGRTLLYHQQGPRLALSTSLPVLQSLPWVPREPSEQALRDYFELRPLAPGTTLFAGVQRVASGYTLSIDARGVRLQRYWRLDPERRIRFSSDDEYREAFLDVFTRAIRSRLRAIGPVGISMSGGLDSTSIAALAAGMLADGGQRLTGFTLVHPRSFDPGVRAADVDPEYRYVEALRAHCPSLDVVYLSGANDRLMEHLRDDFRQTGLPPHSIMFQRRHRTLFPAVRERGIRVLLNGFNGNTIISNSGEEFVLSWVARGRWLRALHGLRALQPLHRASLPRLIRALVLRPLYPEALDGPIARWIPGWRREARSLRGTSDAPFSGWSDLSSGLGDHARQLRRRLNPNWARERMLVDGISGNIADLPTGVRDHWQVDERDPTLDQAVVEFCMALPPEQFLRRGANRFLLRNAMREHLPETILNRAYFLPREPGLALRVGQVRGELSARLDRVERAGRLGFLDYAKLRSLLDTQAHPSSRRANNAALAAMRAVVLGEYAAWLAGDND